MRKRPRSQGDAARQAFAPESTSSIDLDVSTMASTLPAGDLLRRLCQHRAKQHGRQRGPQPNPSPATAAAASRSGQYLESAADRTKAKSPLAHNEHRRSDRPDAGVLEDDANRDAHVGLINLDLTRAQRPATMISSMPRATAPKPALPSTRSTPARSPATAPPRWVDPSESIRFTWASVSSCVHCGSVELRQIRLPHRSRARRKTMSACSPPDRWQRASRDRRPAPVVLFVDQLTQRPPHRWRQARCRAFHLVAVISARALNHRR